ncbi:MAG: CPBP family intramembrane metalloprotease [Bacteroidales bacterium]|nr:CPBP family intramembrane metalloprotease [Bacteroidales bacterium]
MQLIITAFAMISCGLLLMFISILFVPLVDNVSMEDFAKGRIDLMNHLPLLRYMQVMQSISLFLVPAVFLACLFEGNVVRYFNLSVASGKRWYLYISVVILSIIPFINLLSALNEMIVFPESWSALENVFRTMEDAALLTTERLMSVDSVWGLFFNLFMIAVLPALGEELIFRGILQKIFIRWTGNVHAGIIVSAFLFSAMHMQFYGIFPRWLLGVIFGYLLVWSGSIRLPVFAHFIYNALAVVLTYLANNRKVPEELPEFGSHVDVIPITVVLMIFGGLLLWKMKRECRLKYPTGF